MSMPSSTTMTVQPVTLAPYASASRTPCAPGKAGSRAGWVLMIRPPNRSRNVPPNSFMKPASTTRSGLKTATVSAMAASQAARSSKSSTDRTDLIAYDLTTGNERWRRANVPQNYLWPWHVADDTLFSMWWNLEARSTSDGTLKWSTDYPTGDLPTGPTPRMISIATNSTLAIVTFYQGMLGGD